MRTGARARRCGMAIAAALLLCRSGAAENLIQVGSGEGAPGTNGVEVIITASNDDEIHGYSLALSFPSEALEVAELGVRGSHIAELFPEFVGPRIDNELGVATLGVIMNYDEPIGSSAIPAIPSENAPRIIARLTFNVKTGAPGGLYPLTLIDGIGSPPAYNRFTIRGVSAEPALEAGKFFVPGGNVLCVDKSIAFAGQSPNLPILVYAQHPDPLAGFSVATLYDCQVLELLEITEANTDLDFELGRLGLIEFLQMDIDDTVGNNQCRARAGAIFDFVDPFDGQTLSASPNGLYDQSILEYRFNVLAGARDEKEFQDLILDNRDAPGSLNNIFLVGDKSIEPRRVHGKIYFSTGSLTGRVVDRMTGAPVEGALVVTDPDGFQGTTSADGVFRIDDVIPGTYALRVTEEEHYAGFFEDIPVSGDNNIDNAGELGIYRIPPPVGGALFRRGYVNADPRSDISDAIWLLEWQFKGGPAPACMLGADVNDDNGVDLSDSIFLLSWLFSGGRAVPPPVASCGTDPDSELDCQFSPACP